ncbi:MAG TPA: DUF547 domain-containing protein [Gemmatimonadota bacterium]|nr:DUF547 domain-containing protein [Gemmatimonadota bacterium]
MRPRLIATLGAILVSGTAAPLAGQAPPGAGGAEAFADYASLLSQYVDDGAVDYARWKADDPPAWRRFLAWLESADPASMPLPDRRAFWINAYNARVIAGVLKRYPIDSVRDVGFLGGRVKGFFVRREHPVAGRVRTLDEIEQDILLEPPLWDARIHWALSCASLSCPRLRAEPFHGSRLDMQLDFQARTFLNSPNGHRLDSDARTLYLSRIFDWYSEDFERAAGSVRDYAARYLTGAAAAAAGQATYRIQYLDYDWGLNDTR